ncbi:MAG: hypothetical protein LUE11_04835 [Clostridia bacterium]|nr:hypothetical protein [Clostridia bacterium]
MKRSHVVRILKEIMKIDGYIRKEEEIIQQEPSIKTGRQLRVAIAKHQKEIERLERAKEEILVSLDALKYIQRAVLWDHFVKGEYWQRLRFVYYYSERQLRYIADEGLEELGKVFERNDIIKAFLEYTKD